MSIVLLPFKQHFNLIVPGYRSDYLDIKWPEIEKLIKSDRVLEAQDIINAQCKVGTKTLPYYGKQNFREMKNSPVD